MADIIRMTVAPQRRVIDVWVCEEERSFSILSDLLFIAGGMLGDFFNARLPRGRRTRD